MSIPIPNAIVATTIPSREPAHHSWIATRSSVLHAGVVRTGGQTRRDEQLGDAQGGSLQGDVDDRRAGRALAQPLHQQPVALAVGDRRQQQSQVGPVEAGHDCVRLLDPEPRSNVGNDGRRGGRGQRQHALGAELAGSLGELEVVGPEVVAPLRDAVRLVDREERDSSARELREEALVVEALGCDVEELQRAAAEPLADLALLVGTEARVEPGRLDPSSLQEVDLILHQRDQRRDDDRHAVEQQRRQLVAEALPAAGREDGERRPAGQQRLHDAFLPRPKGVEAERRREQRQWGFG